MKQDPPGSRDTVPPTRAELVRLVMGAIACASTVACYGPPRCSESRQQIDVAVSDLTLGVSGGFSVKGQGEFASCMEFCAVQSGVAKVFDCKAPELSVTASKRWVVSCDVEEVDCRSPAIITMGSGRRPEGFTAAEGIGTTLGSYFAHLAVLEHSAISAFRRLARELEFHGAPAGLIRGARRAARDEVRHTRLMAKLATRFGGNPQPFFRPKGLEPRESLEEIALENAREGCVGETLGAIVAKVQEIQALDSGVREAMRVVARDEAEHAILAYEIHAWCIETLEPRSRERVRDEAKSALRRASPKQLAISSRAVEQIAGHPTMRAARSLVATARSSLAPLLCGA